MMKNQKIIFLVLIIVILISLGVGYVAYQALHQQNQGNQNSPGAACTQEAKQCPDGSYVSRTGPNCEFAQCPNSLEDWKTYTNSNYGFQMTSPDPWNGYLVVQSSWTGRKLEESGTITGPLVTIQNPQSTEQQHWQDIPIMVFTKDQWSLVEQEKVAVSAAPIGPAKIGENAKYVFATPPRWYGFTDDLGWQEAVDIVATFKALQ